MTIWGKEEGHYGKFRVKRKTSSKKFIKKCREMNRLIAEMRFLPVGDIVKKLNQTLIGYDHYYGITDNSPWVGKFHYRVVRMLFKWLNRRSQWQSYNWDGFLAMLKDYPIVKVRTYVNIYG